MGDFLEGVGHLGLTPGRHGRARGGLGRAAPDARLAPRRPRPGVRGVRPPGAAPRGRLPARARRRAHPAHACGGGGAARADDAGVPVIAQAAPPPPVISAPPVSFGHAAVRLGAGTDRIEVQADGRITARLRPPPGPRRVSVPVPAGVHAVRVKAIGRGGARWSKTVRIRALPRGALRAGRIPGFVDRALQRDVERLAGETSAITGVYVQHLVTGCGAAVNADAQFPAASTLKAAILVHAVRHGAGRLPRSTLDSMIIDSNDAAANSALAALGGGSGRRRRGAGHGHAPRRSGWRDRWCAARTSSRTSATRCRSGRPPARPLYTNFISTPYELARLMVAVHRGAVGRGGVARLGIGTAEARAELLARFLDVRDTEQARRRPALRRPRRPQDRLHGRCPPRRRNHLPAAAGRSWRPPWTYPPGQHRGHRRAVHRARWPRSRAAAWPAGGPATAFR